MITNSVSWNEKLIIYYFYGEIERSEDDTNFRVASSIERKRIYVSPINYSFLFPSLITSPIISAQ